MKTLKKVMTLFARLYPSAWRKRYGEEFEALLEDIAPSARDAFDLLFSAIKMRIAKGFSRVTLACSVFGTLVFFFSALSL